MSCDRKIIPGNVMSKGVACGPVLVFEPAQTEITRELLAPQEIDTEIERFRQGLQQASDELQKMIDLLPEEDTEKKTIFHAHQVILRDEDLCETIEEHIRSDAHCLCWAIDESFDEFIEILSQAEDILIKERAADMVDTRRRLLACCTGARTSSLEHLEQPAIIVAEDLLPSDTITMDLKNVLGIITEKGGVTSHSAIIARNYGIPGLYGVNGARQSLQNDDTVILNALKGQIVTSPSPAELAEYKKLYDDFCRKQDTIKKYLGAQARTKDGARVGIELNIGSADLRGESALAYVDGSGLFRTEFLYMEQPELPSEETQLEAYKKVLQAFGKRPVTIRTLDIGGDKTLPCMELPKEENPFLGSRALRLCLSRPEVFRTQLRAILRASIWGTPRLMFPMVGSLDDIAAAKAAVAAAKRELDAEGVPYSDTMEIGIMIEIPAIAMIADMAAKEVDFACIGTNDLCQYLTAADRMNPRVAGYYQNFHPAMFRILRQIVEAFVREGKQIAICGEMGGDPAFSCALLGMGMRQFSMTAPAVAEMKRMIMAMDLESAGRAAEKACSLKTASDVQAYLSRTVEQAVAQLEQ